MAANYTVIVFGLDNAGERQKLLGPGTRYDSVQVVRMPLGADLKIRLGQQGDPIPCDQKDGWVDLCGEDSGIFLDVAVAAPGDTISVLVFFSPGGQPIAS